MLEEYMVRLDPTLSIWDSHLTAVCRHLNKNKLNHVLYHVQVFMKVRLDALIYKMPSLKFTEICKSWYTISNVPLTDHLC